MRSTNDPIAGLKQHILDWNVATEDELKSIDKEARSHVAEEVAIAEAMPVPEATPKILYEDIYVPGSEPPFIRGRTPGKPTHWTVESYQAITDFESQRRTSTSTK